MNESYLVLIVLFVGLLLLFALVFIVLQRASQASIVRELQRQQEWNAKSEMGDLKTYFMDEIAELKLKMNQELHQFQSSMSSSLKEDFNLLRESTTQRLGTMENNVHASMEKGLRTTYESFAKVMEQMARIDQNQNHLDALGKQITSLQAILGDKKLRGTFGEVELYALLELQFGVNDQRYRKQYQLQSGKIADAVLFGPKPMGMIAIDAKFPLENYNRMYDNELSKQDQEKARTLFRQDVMHQIKDIATKYIVPGETASFAYMFIPAEAVFAEIYGKFYDVIGFSYECNVYLVSPTTLMAYLTAIQAIYLGQERNENMERMHQEFLKLGKEFNKFSTRWDKLGNDFRRMDADFHDVSITTSKIVQRFRSIESLDLDVMNREDIEEMLDA